MIPRTPLSRRTLVGLIVGLVVVAGVGAAGATTARPASGAQDVQSVVPNGPAGLDGPEVYTFDTAVAGDGTAPHLPAENGKNGNTGKANGKGAGDTGKAEGQDGGNGDSRQARGSANGATSNGSAGDTGKARGTTNRGPSAAAAPAARGPGVTGVADGSGIRDPKAPNTRVEHAAGVVGDATVNVTVTDARAGSHLSVDAAPADARDDVAGFETVAFTPERNGSIAMNVSVSRDRMAGSPAFASTEGAEPLAHVRLEHSISNANVSDVGFTLRVSKHRLRTTETGPEEVVLYRYSDGTGRALPTEFVGETATHYVYRVESPGMSEFVVGALRPEFELSSVAADRTAASTGEPVRIRALVTNVGEADGVFTAELTRDGEVVARDDLTVAAGGTRQVNFEHAFDRPGTYDVRVNGQHVATVTVEAADDGRDDRSNASLPTFFPLDDVDPELGLWRLLLLVMFGLAGAVYRVG